VTGANLGRKQCESGACWEGLQGGLGVCGCGVGARKIFQIPACGVRGGFKICGCGAAADKKFQPPQDSGTYTLQLLLGGRLKAKYSTYTSHLLLDPLKAKYLHTGVTIGAPLKT